MDICKFEIHTSLSPHRFNERQSNMTTHTCIRRTNLLCLSLAFPNPLVSKIYDGRNSHHSALHPTHLDQFLSCASPYPFTYPNTPFTSVPSRTISHQYFRGSLACILQPPHVTPFLVNFLHQTVQLFEVFIERRCRLVEVLEFDSPGWASRGFFSLSSLYLLRADSSSVLSA